MTRTFTTEDLEKINRYLEQGDKGIFGTDIPKNVASLAAMLNADLVQAVQNLQKQNSYMQERIDKLHQRKEREYFEGNFEELGLDSALCFQAVWYCLDHCTQGAWKISQRTAMYVFFEVYAAWLYRNKQRICVERPVAQESGPWFWSAIKKTNKPAAAYRESFVKLCELNPGLAAMVKNAANKYYATREEDLQKFICKCHAWKEATKEHNDGKWNKVLDDAKIYVWRKDVLDSRK